MIRRMVTMSAKDKDDGKSKYDDVRVLDFGKIVDSHAFMPDMSKRIAKEIAQLEAMNTDFNTQVCRSVRLLSMTLSLFCHTLTPSPRSISRFPLPRMPITPAPTHHQLKKDPTQPPTEDEQRDMLLLVKNVIYKCKMEQPQIELQMEVLLEALPGGP